MNMLYWSNVVPTERICGAANRCNSDKGSIREDPRAEVSVELIRGVCWSVNSDNWSCILQNALSGMTLSEFVDDDLVSVPKAMGIWLSRVTLELFRLVFAFLADAGRLILDFFSLFFFPLELLQCSWCDISVHWEASSSRNRFRASFARAFPAGRALSELMEQHSRFHFEDCMNFWIGCSAWTLCGPQNS